MKSNLTKVSLALVSVAFVLSCQDQGTGVEGVEGLDPQFAKKCDSPPCEKDDGGGGGKDVPVYVTVAGGMSTGEQDPQLMQLAEDVSRLRMIAEEPDFELANSLTATDAAAARNPTGEIIFDQFGNIPYANGSGVLCVQTGRGAPNNEWADALFAELKQPLGARGLFVRIDKTALGSTSDIHRIAHADNSEIGGIKIQVFEPTVTVPGDDFSGNFVATFSGGDIAVSGSRTGKIKDRVFLTCPIQPGDDIIVTVAR